MSAGVECIIKRVFQRPAVATSAVLINATRIELHIISDMVFWLIVAISICKHAISIAAPENKILNRLNLQVGGTVEVVIQSFVTAAIQNHLSNRIVQTGRNGCKSVFRQVVLHKQLPIFVINRHQWVTGKRSEEHTSELQSRPHL